MPLLTVLLERQFDILVGLSCFFQKQSLIISEEMLAVEQALGVVVEIHATLGRKV